MSSVRTPTLAPGHSGIETARSVSVLTYLTYLTYLTCLTYLTTTDGMALACHGASRGRRTYNAHCFAVFSTNAHAQRLSSGREPCRVCVIGTHSSRCTTHHVSRERRTCNAQSFAGSMYQRTNSAAFVWIIARTYWQTYARTAWRLRIISTARAQRLSSGREPCRVCVIGTHSSRCTTHHVSRRT